ncbi:anion permease [Pelotomaculum terephthalicicum JT]|uniref:SLC13 family permease n=1 Tax=Pelotomaculum TaxID=191373 RepID=UPI0009C630F5|nr:MULTISPECIES: SLC13 family permease [Pelotomaculum]MCG9969236.1 anion permease [Pelotomaculum terephthalicicum JT]OPX86064.1 MAG: Inner membrane protein YbhI [Pelotomaculum sp. PtaB.Bin117]OPY61161.1 MAG: Inner membrane protein YbhI [Pelotomaculum sp. PtaU1.Bin065]
MSLGVKEITAQMKNAPVFSTCNPQNLARIIPGIVEKSLREGEVLYRTQTPAANIYLVIEGNLKLIADKRVVKEVSSGLFGEEAAIGEELYLTDAIAACSAVVLEIPGESLHSLLENEPQLLKGFFSSLFNHFTDKKLEYYSRAKQVQEQSAGIGFTIGWILAIIVPAVIFYTSSGVGFEWNARLFLMVLSTVMIMWTFNLTPSFLIPCILAILVVIFLGIAPPSVVLAGFTSGTFFMALSVFGLTAVLIASGIAYRLILTVLKYVPPSRFSYVLVMFLTGFTMIPFLPDYSGRVTMISAPLTDMVDTLRYRLSGKAANQLTAALYTGTTHFSSVFLTGSAVNFLIYGLLPLQLREQFTWISWAFAALVFTLVSIILYLLVLFVMFRSEEVPEVSRDQIEAQLEVLGPFNPKEWAALGGVLLFIVGVATSSIHKIDTPWVGLAVLYIFLSLGILSNEEFKKSINWPFLIYLGGMLGIIDAMSYLELDQWLINHFAWIEHYMTDNFYLFIFLLACSITLIGIVADEYTIIILFTAILFPIAQTNAISQWVIGFIILIFAGWWLIPQQDPDFLVFSEVVNSKKQTFSKRAFLTFNAVTVLIRLAALYVSIPFWKWLGLL